MSDLPKMVLKSHHFFHSCNRLLGFEFMGKLWRRTGFKIEARCGKCGLKMAVQEEDKALSHRQLYRWAADPKFTEDHESNPIDRLEIIFERLCEIQREDVAESALALLERPLMRNRRIVPDKNTLLEEICDDLPALVAFQEAMRESSPDADKVYQLFVAAENELEETYQKFLEVNQLGQKGGESDGAKSAKSL